jgi:transcriptional regulator with XRE-family HTH domain
MTENGQGTLGQRVRIRRGERGLTLEQLAEQTGVSVRAISDIERGRTTQPRRATVRLLAGALGLDDIGWDHLQVGSHTGAISSFQLALRLSRENGSHTVAGAILDCLGLAYLRLGMPTATLACYQQCAAEYRQARNRSDEGRALASLGDAQAHFGDTAAAARSWRQALDILGEMHHPCVPELLVKLGVPD